MRNSTGHKKRIIRKRVQVSVLILVLMAGILWKSGTLRAVFDESSAVHVNPDEIEDATLVIGTHLIYLGALTDQLYEIAMQSAAASGQNKMYYKSELAGSAWFEISGAVSLNDITNQGNQVQSSAIRALFLTHHTKSDGITYDLRTGEGMEIFDIINPYNLDTMPELNALEDEYQSMKEGVGGSQKTSNLPDVKKFFESKVSGKDSDKYDEMLKKLTKYKQSLGPEEEVDSALAEVLKQVAEKIDNGRRYLVCQKVSGLLSNLADKVSKSDGGTDLLTAVNSCQAETEDSLQEYAGNRVVVDGQDGGSGGGNGNGGNGSGGNGSGSDGSGGSGSGGSGDGSGGSGGSGDGSGGSGGSGDGSGGSGGSGDGSGGSGGSGDGSGGSGGSGDGSGGSGGSGDGSGGSGGSGDGSGGSGGSGDGSGGSGGSGDGSGGSGGSGSGGSGSGGSGSGGSGSGGSGSGGSGSGGSGSGGSGSGGSGSGGSGSSGSGGNGSSDSGAADSESITIMTQVESEFLNSFLTALKSEDYASCSAALQSLSCLYSIMEGNSVSPDAELKLLDETLIPRAEKAYEDDPSDVRRGELEFFQKTRDLIAGGEDIQTQELNALCDQKEVLKEQYLSALDKQNLKEASQLEAQIAELDKKIAKLGGDVESTQNIKDLRDKALKIVEDKEDDQVSLSADIEAIGALCTNFPELAGAALKEIHQKMASAKYIDELTIYDELIDRAEELIADNLDTLTGRKDVEEVMNIVEAASDTALDGSSPEQDAQALMGLGMYNEQAKSAEIAQLLKGKAEELAGTGKSLVFKMNTQASAGGAAYAPVDVLAEFASYRYIWNSRQKEAVLASGRTYYSFRAFSDMAGREDGKEDELDSMVLFQSVLYLPADYVKQEFGCEVYEIPGTAYAVLVDKEAKEGAAQVCDALITG